MFAVSRETTARRCARLLGSSILHGQRLSTFSNLASIPPSVANSSACVSRETLRGGDVRFDFILKPVEGGKTQELLAKEGFHKLAEITGFR